MAPEGGSEVASEDIHQRQEKARSVDYLAVSQLVYECMVTMRVKSNICSDARGDCTPGKTLEVPLCPSDESYIINHSKI